VERLRAHGLELIVLEHTRPDIAFPVVRVVVPGLRHFWQRLAPGRLYDVPVALGWLERPLSEEELNPIPIFF
jgi:ribosomal protein S12 methylthiotransferase accessory factor